MPVTLDQPRHVENEQEAPQTPQTNPDVVEYNESGLREMVDRAAVEAETQAFQILNHADTRIEQAADASGLDEDSARSILAERGFGERINSIKDRILVLADGAMGKLSAIRQTNEEKIETEIAEGLDEARAVMNLDQYMRAHPRKGLDAATDKIRSVRMRLKGIKEPERVLSLMHYLEKNTQSGAFKFSVSLAERLSTMLDYVNDPVEVIEHLNKFGYEVVAYDFKSANKDVSRFFNDINILPLLKKINLLKNNITFNQRRGSGEQLFIFGSDEQYLLQGLAEADHNYDLLGETGTANLIAISEVLGQPLNIFSLKTWAELARVDGVVELLRIAKQLKGEFEPHDQGYIIQSLENYRNAGIIDDVVNLAKEGFDPDSLGINNIAAPYFSAGAIALQVEQLKSQPEFFRFVSEMPKSLGIKPSIGRVQVAQCRAFYQNPEAQELIKMLADKGMVSESYWNRGAYNPEVLVNDKHNIEVLSWDGFNRFIDLIKESGYQFDFAQSNEYDKVVAAYLDTQFRELIEKSEAREFIRRIGDVDLSIVRELVKYDAFLYPMVEKLLSEFGTPPSVLLDKQVELKDLTDSPLLLETTQRLRDLGIEMNPIIDFDKIWIIAQYDIVNVVRLCGDHVPIRNFVLKNAALITDGSKDNLAACLEQLVKNSENRTMRSRQMINGELTGLLLEAGDYDLIVQTASIDNERAAEVKTAVEKIKEFVEAYPIGGKGRTLATLLAMREYREGETYADVLMRVEKNMDLYKKLLTSLSPHNIPDGNRASIGMEYEITHSTAAGYWEETQSNHLSRDMEDVSRFANVGRGKDGVFEVATKATDNPYLLLLEMKLLQDLRFMDFNFRNPGYEKGSRGYHLTIGGEQGVEVTDNANFLQNTLVISGWGGINAGKEVDRLARSSTNIRARYSHHVQSVFENAKPAVEFRSLSLDTVEPLERTVETAYYGAVAIQVFEGHMASRSRTRCIELVSQASDPQQFYELLRENDLLSKPTENKRVMEIIFEWSKLQAGTLSDLKDHNDNFLQNEMYGYEDERGNWVEPGEFGGAANKDRFTDNLEKDVHLKNGGLIIPPELLFNPITVELANKCTAITNLFIKSSEEFGGDVVNAGASLDTTKIEGAVEQGDLNSKYQSIFDTNGKTRKGYYYTQGGSERMLLHKIQLRLLEFNANMRKIIA
jgi:hypothetical protein